jgi:hypothetical protein
MLNLLTSLGPLRVLLALATLIVIGTSPFFGAPDLSPWGFYPTVIAPTLVVLLLFVLPLDMLMARVFMTGADAAGRERLRRVLCFEALLYLTLIAAWFPLLYALVTARPPI